MRWFGKEKKLLPTDEIEIEKIKSRQRRTASNIKLVRIDNLLRLVDEYRKQDALIKRRP